LRSSAAVISAENDEEAPAIASQVPERSNSEAAAMKHRRETRERIAQLERIEAAVDRSVKARTLSVTEFCRCTGLSSALVRGLIESGNLPTTMIGKSHRITVTPKVRESIVSTLEQLWGAEVGWAEYATELKERLNNL
jgi:hypothetical protein